MATTLTNQIVKLASGPAADWTTVNQTLPLGMIGFESDTGKFKIGDGVKTWAQLEYAVDTSLSEENLVFLEQANAAGGAVILSENGEIPIDYLPAQVQKNVRYVANIEARDAIPIEERDCIIVVLDASGDIVDITDAIEHTIENVYSVADGELQEGGVVLVDFGTLVGVDPEDFEGHTITDITVKTGGAVYTWNGTATNGTWFKISEFESMDIDFTVYFNAVVETLDVIVDGSEFVKFSVDERLKLTMTLTDDDILIIQGPTPAFIKANI